MAYFYIVGHRGAAGLAPENTIPSFKVAIGYGVDFVEFDVRSTREGIPVVIHDERVDRTTNGSGYVRDMSLLELKHLDAGSWFSRDYSGIKIPSLEEALEFLRGEDVGLIIEIKDEGIEEEVIRCVEDMGIVDRTIIASFNIRTLSRARRINDELPLMAISTSFSVDMLDMILRNGARILALHKDTIDADVVKKSMRRGIILNAWVVNNINEAKRLLVMGVNMLSSDFPDVISGLRNKIISILETEKF